MIVWSIIEHEPKTPHFCLIRKTERRVINMFLLVKDYHGYILGLTQEGRGGARSIGRCAN